jgi:hypothetical protein
LLFNTCEGRIIVLVNLKIGKTVVITGHDQGYEFVYLAVTNNREP